MVSIVNGSFGFFLPVTLVRIKSDDRRTRIIVVGDKGVEKFLAECTFLGADLVVVFLGDRVADTREQFERRRVVQLRGKTAGKIIGAVGEDARAEFRI